MTQKIIYLEDGDHGLVMPDNIEIYDKNEGTVHRKVINIKAEIGLITKSGYKHFMEKEIFEQPSVIPQTISTLTKNNTELNIDLDRFGFRNKNTLLITAAGTSYYAAMVGKYWIEHIKTIFKRPITSHKAQVSTKA